MRARSALRRTQPAIRLATAQATTWRPSTWEPSVLLQPITTTYPLNIRAKDFDSASKWLSKAVTNAATAADAHYCLGRMARQESHPDEGTAELNESLALHADSPHVLAKLGEIYMVAHKYSEAALCRSDERRVGN